MSLNKDNFPFPFKSVGLISFPCLFALVATSGSMVNTSRESGQPCLLPDLRGKASNLLPLRTILATGCRPTWPFRSLQSATLSHPCISRSGSRKGYGEGIQVPPLDGGWQSSGRACGTRNTVAAIFGNTTCCSILTDLSPQRQYSSPFCCLLKEMYPFFSHPLWSHDSSSSLMKLPH